MLLKGERGRGRTSDGVAAASCFHPQSARRDQVQDEQLNPERATSDQSLKASESEFVFRDGTHLVLALMNDAELKMCRNLRQHSIALN